MIAFTVFTVLTAIFFPSLAVLTLIKGNFKILFKFKIINKIGAMRVSICTLQIINNINIVDFRVEVCYGGMGKSWSSNRNPAIFE